MVRPIRPCSPACNGWRVVLVSAVPIVQRCPECWLREVLVPGYGYYQRQPECREAVNAVWRAQTRKSE